MKHASRLHRSALMLAIAAAYPALGYGAAGTAQFTTGEVMVRRGAAAPAPLVKGATLESGDAITTGARGIAQVKFTDGGYVSVQPNSQFDITRYADNGNAQSDSFLVNLARGGMRAITGLIGKRNTANYKVTTSTATVGIRGSAFNLVYNPDGTLSVATEQDAIEVCTAAGCIGLTAGEAALVPNATDMPVRTSSSGTTRTDTYRQDPQVAGNQVAGDGSAAIIDGPRVFTGIAFSGAGLTYGGEGSYGFSHEDGAATIQGGGLTNYLSSGNQPADRAEDGTTTTYYTSGSLANRDFITLGSWSSGSAVDSGEFGYNYDFMPLAFVAGVPTSSEGINSLVANNMSAEYALTAGTPVFTSSGNGTLLGTSHISVNFGASHSGTINLDMSLPYNGSSANYSLSGSVSGSGSSLSGSLSSGSGEGYYTGFFGGNNAANIGLSYDGYLSGVGSLAGAAVFGQTAVNSPPVTLEGSYAGFISYDSGEGFSTASVFDADVLVQNGHVIRFTDSSYGYANRGTATTHATVGQPGDAAFLNLGTWSSSKYIYDVETGSGNSYGTASYVIGTLTDSSTMSSLNGLLGTMGTYTLYQGSPIHMDNGSTGTLDYANLTVNFGGYSGSSVGYLDMGMTTAGNSHTMSGTVYGGGSSSATFQASNLSIDSGEGGYGSASGFFSGSNAQYAGLVYEGYLYGESSSFGGAAILSGSVSGPAELPDNGTYSGLQTLAYGATFTTGSPFIVNGGDHTFSSGAPTEATGSNNYSGATVAEYDYRGTGSDFIGWGRWNGGTGYDGSSHALADVHYIVGTPTSNMPTTGTLTYNFTGGTTPTATVGGGITGTLVSASLEANFGSNLVTAAVNTSFNYNSNSYTASMSADMPISGANFAGQSNIGGAGWIAGMFTGDAAARAGYVYQMDHNVLGTISGAAAFTKPTPQ